MEKGNISNEVVGRVLVVTNDFLFHIPDRERIVADTLRRLRQHKRVAHLYEVNPVVRMYLHDLTWRRSFRVDCVHIGEHEKVVEYLQHRLGRMNLAVNNLYPAENVQEVVNSLAYMPEVLYVAHGKPEWGLTFGVKAVQGVIGLRSI